MTFGLIGITSTPLWKTTNPGVAQNNRADGDIPDSGSTSSSRLAANAYLASVDIVMVNSLHAGSLFLLSFPYR